MRGKTDAAVSGLRTEKPRIALTFDDGPNAMYTNTLLDGLKERGMKATFFLIGENIEGKEEIVQRMYQEGHLIGNHTYHHVKLDAISETEAIQEIQKTNNRIFEITGYYPVFIRAPFGAWKKNLELKVDMIPVFWDIDTLDWKNQNKKQILNIVKKEAKDGAVILMHDAYASSVEAVFQMVDVLRAAGYEFVTVDTLIVS